MMRIDSYEIALESSDCRGVVHVQAGQEDWGEADWGKLFTSWQPMRWGCVETITVCGSPKPGGYSTCCFPLQQLMQGCL